MTFRRIKRLSLAGLFLFVVLSFCPWAWPDQDDKELAADRKALKDAGVATDEPGLLEFSKRHTGTESQRRLVEQLIKQLGDDDFMVREEATRELKSFGSAARLALQKAKNHKDPEIASRAMICLDALSDESNSELLARAARVLSTFKSAKAVDVLLAFLPDAADAGVEEDIIWAMRVLGVSEGKIHPALVQALADKVPLRRAAAGEMLADLPEHVEAVRKLMQDTEPSVRLRVSLALVCFGERKAVPILIDLLPQLTHDQAWQVENVLYRLGGSKVPQLPVGDGEAARKKYRDECHAWWKDYGAKADLSVLEGGPRRKARVRARASCSWESNTPDKAFDGDQNTVWNAGAPPGQGGQWIEADLGAVRQLGGLRLITCQLPDGPTTHQIWVSNKPIGADRTKAMLAHTFKGQTKSAEMLHFEFPKNRLGRYVQIRTIESPSWVAWSEIEFAVR